MRLIDADALLKKLDDSIWYNVADFNEAWYAVDHAPPVDAVPVVRCRDCKKAEHDKIFREYWCKGRKVDPDGYCSDGERKDGDGNG